jgi:hypothetical protein
MTQTLTPRPKPAPRTCKRPEGRPAARGARRSHGGRHDVLGRYAGPSGAVREIVARPGSHGSVLVIDRDASTLGDRRLVAHLAADEPPLNAAIVCGEYLRDPLGRRCRAVTPEDLLAAPFANQRARTIAPRAGVHELLDRHGFAYSLRLCPGRTRAPELRWTRRPATGTRDLELRGACRPATGTRDLELRGACRPAMGTRDLELRGTCRPAMEHGGAPTVVSLRDVFAALESYEPVRTLTVAGLADHEKDARVSLSRLRGELRRSDASSIVLNRGLREAVLTAMRTDGLSLSQIAARCGRVKRDGHGAYSGETSWLTRRVGLQPEGGESTPTPWVHSDVLALIACRGLGLCPREVELG